MKNENPKEIINVSYSKFFPSNSLSDLFFFVSILRNQEEKIFPRKSLSSLSIKIFLIIFSQKRCFLSFWIISWVNFSCVDELIFLGLFQAWRFGRILNFFSQIKERQLTMIWVHCASIHHWLEIFQTLRHKFKGVITLNLAWKKGDLNWQRQSKENWNLRIWKRTKNLNWIPEKIRFLFGIIEVFQRNRLVSLFSDRENFKLLFLGLTNSKKNHLLLLLISKIIL